MDKLSERMKAMFDEVERNSMRAAHRRQQQYDAHVKPLHLDVGDLVLLRIEQFPSSSYRKWSPWFDGIYVVRKRINEVNYVISKLNGSETMAVHVDRLKKYTVMNRNQ